MKVLPHVAQNTSNRCSAVPDHIAATDGNVISQQKRKLIKQGFGWAKFIGPIRQVMVRGLKRVGQLFVLTMAAYKLMRMRNLEQIRLKSTRKGPGLHSAKSVSEYFSHADSKVGFADQYFSSLRLRASSSILMRVRFLLTDSGKACHQTSRSDSAIRPSCLADLVMQPCDNRSCAGDGGDEALEVAL